MLRMCTLFLTAMMLNSFKAASQQHLQPVADSIEAKPVIQILPQNFYNKHLGYFCKKEVQLQKAVKLPVFIRLGSKEYVDRMEGKGISNPARAGNKE